MQPSVGLGALEAASGRISHLYFSPKRTTTTSASSSSVRVRMEFMAAPSLSQFGLFSSIPRMIAPQSSESSWDVFGDVRFTGRLAALTPAAMRSRQSEWISPERYTFHVLALLLHSGCVRAMEILLACARIFACCLIVRRSMAKASLATRDPIHPQIECIIISLRNLIPNTNYMNVFSMVCIVNFACLVSDVQATRLDPRSAHGTSEQV